MIERSTTAREFFFSNGKALYLKAAVLHFERNIFTMVEAALEFDTSATLQSLFTDETFVTPPPPKRVKFGKVNDVKSKFSRSTLQYINEMVRDELEIAKSDSKRNSVEFFYRLLGHLNTVLDKGPIPRLENFAPGDGEITNRN